MKRIIFLIVVLGFVMAGSTQAEVLTGRDIALKMQARNTAQDSRALAVMVINRKGKKLVRKMETFSKKYGPDERSVIRFIEPAEVRGIMYLTWS